MVSGPAGVDVFTVRPKVVATNAIFVLYAHTGNTDVPYLFWLTWAFFELDRVLRDGVFFAAHELYGITFKVHDLDAVESWLAKKNVRTSRPAVSERAATKAASRSTCERSHRTGKGRSLSMFS